MVVTLNGCSSASSIVNNYSMGINGNLTLQDNFEIVPNPNDGYFVMSLDIKTEGVYVTEIINSLGQVVYNEKFNGNRVNNKKEFSVPDLGKGIYFLRVTYGDKQLVKRMSIN